MHSNIYIGTKAAKNRNEADSQGLHHLTAVQKRILHLTGCIKLVRLIEATSRLCLLPGSIF